MKTTHLKFIDVCKLLWDKEGWFIEPNPLFEDAIAYRDTGIWFFLDQGCIVLHGRGFACIHESNPLSWICFTLLCIRLRRHLMRKSP